MDWWDIMDRSGYWNDRSGGGFGGDRGGGGGGAPVQPPANTEVNDRDAEEDECSSAGNPIVRSSGNKIEPEMDFTTSGELPLTLERTYNHYWQGVGLFGKYWVSSFDYKLTFGTTAVDNCYPRPGGGRCAIGNKTVIYAWRPDGRTIKYTKRADGLFHEDKPKALSTIEQLADGSFILRRAQGGREAYSSAGYVRYIQDYTSARWTYSYTNTYPARVIHTSGREVQFTWTDGQLTSVKDPAGSQYRYTYTANVFGTGLHRLASTKQPGSPATELTYHYEIGSDASALRCQCPDRTVLRWGALFHLHL